MMMWIIKMLNDRMPGTRRLLAGMTARYLHLDNHLPRLGRMAVLRLDADQVLVCSLHPANPGGTSRISLITELR